MTDTLGHHEHNQPPKGDPFLASLEEKHRGLTARRADLELRRLRLPKEAKSDDDVALFNQWNLDARALAGEFEATREAVKKPYLERTRQIDGWFGTVRDTLTEEAKAIVGRARAYLVAKQEAERIAREAEAAARREAAAKAQREAAEAQRLADEKRRAREAEEQRMRDEEAARRQAAEPVAEPAPDPEALRRAHQEQEAADQEADRLAEESRRASLQADRANDRAAAPGLGRIQGGGGASRLATVWVAKVRSWPALLQSLGPLAQHLKEDVIQDALGRAARAERPAIPGVEYVEETEVRTTRTRS